MSSDTQDRVEALLHTEEGRKEIRQSLMPEMTDRDLTALEREMRVAGAKKAHVMKEDRDREEPATDPAGTRSGPLPSRTHAPPTPALAPAEGTAEVVEHVDIGEEHPPPLFLFMHDKGQQADTIEGEPHHSSSSLSSSSSSSSSSLSSLASGEQLHILAPITAGGKMYTVVLPRPNIEPYPLTSGVEERAQPSAPTTLDPTSNLRLTASRFLTASKDLVPTILLTASKILVAILIATIVILLSLYYLPLTLCPRNASNLPYTSRSRTILPPPYTTITTTNDSAGTYTDDLRSLRTAGHLLLAAHASCPPSQDAMFALDAWIGAIDAYLLSSNGTSVSGYRAVGVAEAVSRLLPPLSTGESERGRDWLTVFDRVVAWGGRVSWGSEATWRAGKAGLRGGVVEVLGSVVEAAMI